jgi:hypothetical protein
VFCLLAELVVFLLLLLFSFHLRSIKALIFIYFFRSRGRASDLTSGCVRHFVHFPLTTMVGSKRNNDPRQRSRHTQFWISLYGSPSSDGLGIIMTWAQICGDLSTASYWWTSVMVYKSWISCGLCNFGITLTERISVHHSFHWPSISLHGTKFYGWAISGVFFYPSILRDWKQPQFKTATGKSGI